MGRKGGRANASCVELSEMDRFSESTASATSAWSFLDERLDGVVINEVERQLDSLFEKRGSTREKALEALTVMLRCDVKQDDCLAHNETLTSRCLISLKKGSSLESSLASQLLGLHVLTLGQPDDRLFLSLQPELERVARNGAGGVSAAAVDALALAAFVLVEDEAHTRAVMDRMRSLWTRGDAKTRSSAVRGWSFLLTSLDRPLLDTEAVAAFAALAALTHDSNIELRSAAGEAATVLQSCCSSALRAVAESGSGEEEGEDEEEGEEEPDRRQHHAHHGARGGGGGAAEAPAGPEHHLEADAAEAPAGANGAARGGGGGGGKGQGARGRRNSRRASGGSGAAEVEELMGRMQDLASNKGDKLRRSRRERAAQRSTFRQLLGALSGSAAPPSQRVKLQHGDSLLVEGVVAGHRLDFMRRVLAGGFQAHLQRNPLLHDVFGFRPRAEQPPRMTALEKRLSRSCHSAEARAREYNRQYNRDAKASRMDYC